MSEIIAVISIISGFLITILYHKLALKRSNRKAILTYKSAFAKEIYAISKDKIFMNTFTSAFEKHKAAVETVQPFLSKRHQKILQKAWDDYCGKDYLGIDVELFNLGIDEELFIGSCTAAGFSEGKDNALIYSSFINRFKELYSCLDKLM